MSSTVLAGGQLEASSATATLSSAAATLNKSIGRITTEALTTAAEATESFTITCDKVSANSTIYVSITDYSGAGAPVVAQVNPAAGEFVVTIVNSAAAAALDAALVFDYAVLGEIT